MLVRVRTLVERAGLKQLYESSQSAGAGAKTEALAAVPSTAAHFALDALFERPVQAEVVELLCGMDRVDAAFSALLANLKRLLERGSAGVEAAALRRGGLRLLLCLTAAAANLNQNILVEFVTLHGLAPAVVAAMVETSRSISGETSVGWWHRREPGGSQPHW